MFTVCALLVLDYKGVCAFHAPTNLSPHLSSPSRIHHSYIQEGFLPVGGRATNVLTSSSTDILFELISTHRYEICVGDSKTDKSSRRVLNVNDPLNVGDPLRLSMEDGTS